MKRSISNLLFLFCLMALTPLYAGTQTLTTYYPAPQGNYLNLTVNDALTYGAMTSETCPSYATPMSGSVASSLSVINVSGQLYLCAVNSAGAGVPTPLNLWTTSDGVMSPLSFPGELSVGSVSITPTGLTVVGNGPTSITGAPVILDGTGFAGSGAAVELEGNNVAVNINYGGGGGNNFQVNGPSVLGNTSGGSAYVQSTNIAGPATINGNVTIVSPPVPSPGGVTLTVNGNTILGTASASPADTTIINGSTTINSGPLTLTGPASASNPPAAAVGSAPAVTGSNISVCDTNAHCGFLAVDCTSYAPACYAAYSP